MPRADGMASATSKPCPICARPPAPRYHPFCSKRCADVDLGRWLKGVYVLPGAPDGNLPEEPGEERTGEET